MNVNEVLARSVYYKFQQVEWCSFLLGQCTSSLIRSYGRKIDRVRVPTHFVSPCPLDFIPSEYCPFLNLKKGLAGRRFYSKEKVIAKTKAYFAEWDKSYYSKGINETGAALDEVYKSKRWLCRKMEVVCPEKLSSFYVWTNFLTHPRIALLILTEVSLSHFCCNTTPTNINWKFILLGNVV